MQSGPYQLADEEGDSNEGDFEDDDYDYEDEYVTDDDYESDEYNDYESQMEALEKDLVGADFKSQQLGWNDSGFPFLSFLIPQFSCLNKW